MAEYRGRKELDGMALVTHEISPDSVASDRASLVLVVGGTAKPTVTLSLSPTQARDLSRALWEEAEALEAWAEQKQAEADQPTGTH